MTLATSTDDADALHRLLAIARSDTGQSGRVTDFLLAWWNPQDCGKWALTDLWSVDRAIADDMLSVAAFISRRPAYPDTYGLGAEFEALMARWRPHLLAPPADKQPATVAW